MNFPISLLQLNTGNDIAANIAATEPLLRQAADFGAKLVTLPENAFYLRAPGASFPLPFPTLANHTGILAAQEWAVKYHCWILVGSVAVVDDESQEKPYNRLVLINPDGMIFSFYDKIHLFDATLAGGETYLESGGCIAGNTSKIAEVEGIKLGLSICYDLRFPQLYRRMALAGAEILAIPAAFTFTTGVLHWHTLLRARAIENGCYVVAPAQCGEHVGGRRTYGHSLVVDPMGKIIAEASEAQAETLNVVLDMAQVAEARARIPSLANERPFD